ncbi:retrovirus-related pol polyprotein from transposon TNT 1-94 [Tanacetum coccineum]
MRQGRWIELFSNYDSEIHYHPGKANVVADALRRKERVKPKRVRAMNMILQSSIKDRILTAQKEITVLTTNTPYPSRKIQRICACTHQRPRRTQDQYAVSRKGNTPYSSYMEVKYSRRYQTWSILQETLIRRIQAIGYAVHNGNYAKRNYQEESFTHKEEMAPMASSDPEVKTCSKTCLNNYETLKKQYDDLLAKQLQTKFEASTYKRGLDTVEAQLVTYRKNEVLFSEEVVVLKREVGIKQYEINTLKTEFEKLKQEKDGIEFKIEKFDKASKDLDQLLESQITDKSKKGLGYSAVPPPHPLIYNRPNKLDLSYSGLDEFKEPEFKGYGPENSKKESNVVCEKESDNSKENSDKSLVKEQESQVKSSFVEGSESNTSKNVSEVEPKKVKKNNDALIIEDWVSDDEEQDKSMSKPEKKTVIPTAAKIEKPVKKSVRYAEMYRSQRLRGNQRNWNGQKSNQLAQSTVQRPFYKNPALTNRNFNHKVTNVRPRIVNIARSYRTPINTVRPRVIYTARQNRTSVNAARANGFNVGKLQHDDKGFVDSGCSRNMTGNIAYLSDFKQFDGGYVVFGGGAYGGKFSGKVTAGTVSNNSAGTLEENSQECIVMPIWKDSSYFDSPIENVDNGEPLTFAGIKTYLGISKEVGTPRYLSLVVPLTKVGNEAVHKELGDRMERAATTASSLEAEQDNGSGPRCQDTILGDVNAQTRFEITSIQSINPPLSRDKLIETQKGKYGDTRPEDEFERVLYGDLRVMFEPDIKSDVWRMLQGYRVTTWKLIDSSGVHFVRFDNLHIFMLVERRYPLTPITITNMLNKKLQTDHQNEMCYQLLKLMIQKMNIKFRGGLLGLKRLHGFLEVTAAQEQIKNDKAFKENQLKGFLKEREQYFEIQDLKAQLQDKGIAISELKKLIEKMKGKFVETKVEKPSVIRQPNAFKSQRQSILGKPATFSDSLIKTDFSKSKTKMPMAVPISTKEPKRTVNQSVATSLRRTLVEIILFIVDSGCSKHMTRNLKLLSNFVEKFLGTVKFGNDHIAPILGYGDLVQGNTTIKRFYNVEGLNHNLFSVGQFCDADLEVAFRKSTCYICDLKGNDLLTGSRSTDLYSITLQDTSTPNPICLMVKATSSQAWLWHHRLSHLNFDSINLLSKNDIVIGLPKLKFVKDHLCSSCDLGKANYSNFKSKTIPSSKG